MTDAEQRNTANRTPLLSKLLPEPGPGRLLVLCTAVASLGNGLYMTGGAVYFVRVVNLTPGQVGIGLSAAGVIALLLGVPIGYLADRFGPRGMTAALALCKAAMLISAVFVQSFTTYLVIAALLGAAEQGGHVARGALVSGVMGREGRVKLSAYMRSVFNGGFAIASLAAGLVIAVDSPDLYLSLFWGNAAAMALVATLYMRLPHVPRQPRQPRPKRSPSAVRDLPYITVAQVSGLARIGPTALALGLPLWLVTHTEAPRALAAWLMLVNTLMVVFLQVYVARGADTVPGASRLQRWTFLVLAVACIVAGCSAGLPGWAAASVLVIATVFFTFGEIWGEAARWGLRYELAPDNAQGQYGGVFATGDALAVIAGPALVTTLPDRFGLAGWLSLAALFTVSLAVAGPAVRWAARTRIPATEESNLQGATPATTPRK
ncbi:MFS transporter [Streptomyces spiroverticillatus]|uniref:MFS transporter n=1 Tax=Streptomyces finlayi TaxID=67296 RepID=A0A918X7W8_9ACTN|nr:MFS transporter [Streptomyces finlayi]GHA43937.1 MFS transporter [Streptomyces spiroverticillatus]GHD17523.1 MFS transporter [Streptomyces finlayi]